VTKDEAKAAEYYRHAADLGNAAAMNNLGLMCIAGQGAQRNAVEAIDWFQKAAALDNVEAMRNLSQAYRKGIGVAVDLTKADEWEERAATAKQVEPLPSGESSPTTTPAEKKKEDGFSGWGTPH
jgi:TPR repeat protein